MVEATGKNIQSADIWMHKGWLSVPMTLAGTEISVQRTKLAGRRQRLLTRYWYRLGSRHTANDYIAKLLEAAFRLLGLREDAALIVVSTHL